MVEDLPVHAHLAQKQIAALFVQMAYYGPRRPPGSNLRLLSTDRWIASDALVTEKFYLRCLEAAARLPL